MRFKLSFLIINILLFTNNMIFAQSNSKSNSADCEKGLWYFIQGQTTSGLNLLTKAAEAGNVEAQAILGNIYYGDYWGIPMDYDMRNPPVKTNKALADKWLNRAAKSISGSPKTSNQRDALSNLSSIKFSTNLNPPVAVTTGWK